MGEWIPLMDYAMKKGISLSTLRRYIKANKVQYRVENGRYLLLAETGHEPAVSAVSARPARVASSPSSQADDFLVSQLQTKLKKAQEEIAELKCLIAFYEENLTQSSQRAPGLSPVTPHPSSSSLNRFNG